MSERKISDPVLGSRFHLPQAAINAMAELHWSLLRLRPPGLQLRVLFVLSHQRSGSSLLVHLLNTNPQIIGYGESLLHYASKRDLRRLPLMVMARTRKPVALQRYVVDKLLYAELLEETSLLRHDELRTIFLVREPEGALRSLIQAPKLDHWPQQPNANRDHVDHEVATKYYCDRLRDLEEYSRIVDDKERSVFITHQQLLERTDEVFGAFQKMLRVKKPFSEQYEILPTTGASGYGDVSDNIKRGFVDRQIERQRIEIREDLVENATAAFSRCSETLREHCMPLS
jgi:hypothetical protein